MVYRSSKKELSRLLSHSSSATSNPTLIITWFTHSSAAAFKPQRVGCIREEKLNTIQFCKKNGKSPGGTTGNGNQWLVLFTGNANLEFLSERKLFNHYVRFLADYLGSKEEAKKRIYLASCGRRYGFGAEIDKWTARRISATSPCDTWEDSCYATRKKDIASPRFRPLNRYHQLDNIFSYYHLSQWNRNWDHNHWLINMKKPEGDQKEMIDSCIKMLAKVVGSEESAHEKIYVIWFKFPFGFGAEIDEETVNKLKGLPDIVNVLPDYAFDTKATSLGALNIFPSSCGMRFSNYDLTKNHSKDWLVGMEEYADDSGDSIYSPLRFLWWCLAFFEIVVERNCKNWFITMEQTGTECTSLRRRISACTKTIANTMGRSTHPQHVNERIYRIKCGYNFIGIGIKIDEEASSKLKGLPGITVVAEDHCYDARTDSSGVQTTPQFTSMNRNARLVDLYSYHHLSAYNSEWDHDHWVVHVKQPHGRLSSERKTLEYCIRLLAKALGSEEEAKRKIYIVWSNKLCGFGAQVDKETSDKLKDRSDVLVVLPDFAFDVKNKDSEVVVVSAVTQSFGSCWQSMFYRPLTDDSEESEDESLKSSEVREDESQNTSEETEYESPNTSEETEDESPNISRTISI